MYSVDPKRNWPESEYIDKSKSIFLSYPHKQCINKQKKRNFFSVIFPAILSTVIDRLAIKEKDMKIM